MARGRRFPYSRITGLLFLTLAASCFSPAGDEAAAAAQILHLRDEAGGGDCELAGTWDPAAARCTLTRDISGRILIDSDNITLDGGGHSLTGSGPADAADFTPGPDGGGDGVGIYRRRGVTVRNLVLTNYDYGINLVESRDITVTGVTISRSGLAGISLHAAANNMLSGNTISNAGINTGICVGYSSNGNIITGNVVSDSSRGIYLHTYCSGNIISANTLAGNVWGLTLFEADGQNLLESNSVEGGTYGIFINDGSDRAAVRNNIVKNSETGILLSDVQGASIYHNLFLDNATQAAVTGAGANNFHLALPSGGNFWSDFAAAGGCEDADNDGVCDAAYTFAGGDDSHPWLQKNGWRLARPHLNRWALARSAYASCLFLAPDCDRGLHPPLVAAEKNG